MPKGPQGQKRPADVIGAAIHVAKIATGEIEEDGRKEERATPRGEAGGKARAANLTKEQRKKIAKDAADARWTVKQD